MEATQEAMLYKKTKQNKNACSYPAYNQHMVN